MVSRRSARKFDRVTIALIVAIVCAYIVDFVVNGYRAWWHPLLLPFLWISPKIAGWQFGVDLESAAREGERDFIERTSADEGEIQRKTARYELVQRYTKLGLTLIIEAGVLLVAAYPKLLNPYTYMYAAFVVGGVMIAVMAYGIVAAIQGKV